MDEYEVSTEPMDLDLDIWFCESCNWTMRESQRGAHIKTESHIQRLQWPPHPQTLQLPFRPKSPAPGALADTPFDSYEDKSRDATGFFDLPLVHLSASNKFTSLNSTKNNPRDPTDLPLNESSADNESNTLGATKDNPRDANNSLDLILIDLSDDDEPTPLSSNYEYSFKGRPRGQQHWTCRGCRQVMDIVQKKYHLCDTPHSTTMRQRAEKWTCDECGINMNMTDRESHLRDPSHEENAAKRIHYHPNGKRHIKIKDISRVYRQSPIPVRLYKRVGAYRGIWKGAASFVTAEQIEKVSREFEGEERRGRVDARALRRGEAFRNRNRYF
ncbi:hypothetical protein BO70DRAFT_356700 [Aspergillus heteromorphus CBS 117.55]|uniref:Uncharacterized protein n=1 Tax=Aspergillus heteromorphus CBS 117.55 TaxID=1448321 RepID=A0A317V0P0_9EURO|nr:uncharacterized protein BO70DRAFT_356700 [Aspergillus heteromorphus CBS 117.55]PWY65740.1 hypothetical protein BO70DRAFT_356700 [Aspergillus heteromorphus CBS 117.55]